MKTYIGYAKDFKIRYAASSGGIGSAMVKYLLEEAGFDYALNFRFDSNSLCYYPVLISNFDEYNICGSIYNEIKLIPYVKEILKDKMGKRIVFFSLPCQTRTIRSLCKKAKVESFIIGLTCSSQQSFEATEYLLSRYKIKKSDIVSLQYRGNGWPSGIQIVLKDGSKTFIKNNGSLWTDIFHSRLFIYPRCFRCNDTLNSYCDMVLADPWLPEFFNDTIGKTLFSCYTSISEKYITDAISSGHIIAESIDNSKLEKSQNGTIQRKKSYKNNPKLRMLMSKVFLSKKYRNIVTCNSFFFKIHNRVKSKIEHYME